MTSRRSGALVRREDAPRSLFQNVKRKVRDGLTAWTHAQGGPGLAERLQKLPTDTLNELGIDSFGFDPEFTKAVIAPLVWLYQNYFRVETHGIGNVPPGKVFLVANHSGQIPMDAAMLGISLFLEADPPRIIRAMFEKWVPRLPFISIVFARAGQVVGTPENCRRLLDQGECCLVYPEGARGISKPFQKRYQLEEFGLGFMRLALENDTPIVPVAIIGAEEQIISIANVKRLGKLIGMPSFPLIPQLLVPVLGWAPLPTKYRIYFGEPMRFAGNPEDEDAEIEKKVKVVRNAIQQMIDEGLRARRSVFF